MWKMKFFGDHRELLKWLNDNKLFISDIKIIKPDLRLGYEVFYFENKF